MAARAAARAWPIASFFAGAAAHAVRRQLLQRRRASPRLGLDQWTKFFGDRLQLQGDRRHAAARRQGGAARPCCSAIRWRWSISIARRALQRVLIFVIVLPLLTSVVVRTFAWIVMLGREGVVNQTLIGARPDLRAAAAAADRTRPRDLADPDRDAADAAAAAQRHVAARPEPASTPRRRSAPRAGAPCSRVILPLSMPGLVAGCLLVFASRHHRLHLADRDRRRAAGLPAAADLAAVDGRLQLAASPPSPRWRCWSRCSPVIAAPWPTLGRRSRDG